MGWGTQNTQGTSKGPKKRIRRKSEEEQEDRRGKSLCTIFSLLQVRNRRF